MPSHSLAHSLAHSFAHSPAGPVSKAPGAPAGPWCLTGAWISRHQKSPLRHARQDGGQGVLQAGVPWPGGPGNVSQRKRQLSRGGRERLQKGGGSSGRSECDGLSCVPPNSQVGILTPRTSECDYGDKGFPEVVTSVSHVYLTVV